MTYQPKILITGASSEIMQKLIKRIDKKKYQIIALTRNRNRICNPDIEVVEGDICDPHVTDRFTQHVKLVIHAAAITHSINKADYYEINYNGTKNLVNSALLNNTQNFVFISSRVAGENSGAYGKSKLYAERIVKKQLDDWLIFRPGEVFGGNKMEGIEKLIFDVLHKKLIFYPAGLTSKLYPVFIDDLVDIIYNSIFIKNDSKKTITVNGDKGYTYHGLQKHLLNILHKNAMMIPVPKAVLYLLKWLIEIGNFNIGIVPDQIPRLYSNKEIQLIKYNYCKIETYLLTKYVSKQ